jgi:competence protein ComEC
MTRKHLSILDVGHGNCAVLVDEQGVVVIDAGPGSALLEYLDREGINKVDVLLISHADKDHIEGVISLISSEAFHIGIVRVNSDASKSSKLWDDLLYLLSKSHIASEIDFDVSLTVRDSGKYNQGCINIEVLAPDLYVAGKGPGALDRLNRPLTSNSVSSVIRLSLDGHPLTLFPGDIDGVGLANLLDERENVYSPIVVFPHHGGKPGTGDAVSFAKKFYEATLPNTIIFSIGRGRYNTPQPEIIFTLRQLDPSVRIACTQLSRHCCPVDKSLTLHHLTGKFSRGHEVNYCCAGTLVIDLENPPVKVYPLSDTHQEFIGSFVPNPLCLKEID